MRFNVTAAIALLVVALLPLPHTVHARRNPLQLAPNAMFAVALVHGMGKKWQDIRYGMCTFNP